MEEIKKKVEELIAAPSCCAPLRAAAEAYLDAIGTEKEAAARKTLLEQIDASVTTIDELIDFAGSPAGASAFGKERAAGVLAHAEEIKAQGAKYCDCGACTAAVALWDMLQ